MTLPVTLAPGASFTLKPEWSNVNVAPAYDDWQVQYQPRNSLTDAIVYQDNSSLNLRLLLPTYGTPKVTNDTFTLPLSVPAGTFKLLVKVVDTGNYLLAFRLANTGRTTDGAYFLGNITVSY